MSTEAATSHISPQIKILLKIIVADPKKQEVRAKYSIDEGMFVSLGPYTNDKRVYEDLSKAVGAMVHKKIDILKFRTSGPLRLKIGKADVFQSKFVVSR